MKKQVITIIVAFFSITAFPQVTKCDCKSVFDELMEKVETNYIGLKQMEGSSRFEVYLKRKDTYLKKASNIKPENCTKFLQEFLSFFEDGHLFVFERPEYSEEEAVIHKKYIKNKIKSPKSVLTTLNFEKNMVEKTQLDGIIGKWTDGQSEMAIIKDEGFYRAYIISSKIDGIEPGELKAQFKSTKKGFDGTYYSYNYQPRYVEGNIYKEKSLIVLTGGMYWGKLGDLSNREVAMINKEDIALPVIKKLDDKNTLFSIPSFLTDYNKFIKVITDNIELLKSTTNLIIDIRGNVGGNAIYFSFIDAYATQALSGGQGLVLASKHTLEYFERLAKNSPEVYQPLIERIKKNMGKIIDGPKYPDKQFKPFESNIKNVAILTDRGSMSAAESFILHSKGCSSKVTTFGSPTGGVIDYTSINTVKLKSGKQNIYFGYPTSTYHKDIPEKGFNKTGIIPDVNIKENVKDKVQFVMDYFKKTNN